MMTFAPPKAVGSSKVQIYCSCLIPNACGIAMTNIHGTKPVFLFNGTRAIRINLADVVYIKADHVHCTMVMSDGTQHQLSYPLGHLEPMLPISSFIRIHRQHIINVWHMEMFIGSYIRMDNGDSLSLGKTYREALDPHIMVISECVGI